MADPYIHQTTEGHIFALGSNRRPPDPREWAYQLTPPMVVDRTKPRSLAQYFPACFDQGAEGSCTANSSIAVQMACATIAGVAPVTLSREDLYYLERVKEGTFPQDAGAYTADSFDCVLSNGGLPAESDWAYDQNPAEKPPAGLAGKPVHLYITGHQPLAGANFIDGTIAALDNKQPLVLAFSFYQEFFGQYQQTGVLSGSPKGQPVGGHQIAVKGWVPAQGGLIWCQNSWGATSPARTDLHPEAKAGDIFLPIALLQSGVVDEIRAAVGIATPAPTPSPTPTPNPQPQPNPKAFVDAVFVADEAALAAQQVGDHSGGNVTRASAYAFAMSWLKYTQGGVDAVLTGTTAGVPTTPPVLKAEA